jgi:hypothetical protein
MSDFLAIAAVRGKVLHLVDWDRPCWFLADNPEGDRLIPDPDSILTDALLFYSFADFDMPFDLFAGKRNKNKVFEMKDSHDFHSLDEARRTIRGRKEPFVLLAHFGQLDELIQKDIQLHKTNIMTAQIRV